MKLYTGPKSGFAIRSEDALSWHIATKHVAGIAERSGFRIRANRLNRHWEIWATDGDFDDLHTAYTRQNEKY